MESIETTVANALSWSRGSVPLILVGPTAVGKTDVAVELAHQLGGEIINADSMQVYVGMNIGTAKPALDARSQIPFHLLDVVRPDQYFSVSEWKRQAETAIVEIAMRGRLPIICGGTGLYIRALVDDWTLAHTPADTSVRAILKLEAERIGVEAMHARLALVDPIAAARLHPNDSVRVVRALEVYTLTGTPITEYQRHDRQNRAPRYVHKIGLTLPRQQLYERIDRRVENMVIEGLETEVRNLIHQGFSRELGPMRSLGYKEMCALIYGETDRQSAIEMIKLNTRRFSKRQQTWFRVDSQIQWIDVTALNSATVAERARELIWGEPETAD